MKYYGRAFLQCFFAIKRLLFISHSSDIQQFECLKTVIAVFLNVSSTVMVIIELETFFLTCNFGNLFFVLPSQAWLILNYSGKLYLHFYLH